MSKIILIFTFFVIIAGTIIMLYRWDRKNPEPFKNILFCLMLGVIAFVLDRFVFRFSVCKILFGNDLIEFTVRINDEFVPMAGNPAYGSWSRLLFSAFIIGGLLKEGITFFFIGYVLNRFRKHVDEARDPFVYAMYVAIPFALLDGFTHYYVDMAPFRSVYGTLNYLRFDLIWVVMRLFTVHFGGAMAIGFGYSMARFNYEITDSLGFRFPGIQNRRNLNIPIGFLMAILLHGITTLSFGARQWGWVLLGLCLVLAEIWVMRWVMKRIGNVHEL